MVCLPGSCPGLRVRRAAARRMFETIWSLAQPVSYEELQALSEGATETRDRELVRLTGRVAFGFVDDGWTGIEVRQISSTSWDQPVMIPEAFLAGPQNGDIIDIVGWVGVDSRCQGTPNPHPQSGRLLATHSQGSCRTSTSRRIDPRTSTRSAHCGG